MIENIVVLVVLVCLALEDAKCKSIDMKHIIGVGVFSIAYVIIKRICCGDDVESMLVMAGAVFVALLLIMSLVLKSLGMGDVVILVLLMMVKGVVFAVCTLVTAITILAVVATGLMLSRRVKRKDTVAFVPYICVSALGVMFCV